jgi:hypothetical protein
MENYSKKVGIFNENNESSNEIEYAAWVLFREESIDCELRFSIAFQILKINTTAVVFGQNFRPNQIEIDPYNNHFICGERAFKKLTGYKW